MLKNSKGEVSECQCAASFKIKHFSEDNVAISSGADSGWPAVNPAMQRAGTPISWPLGEEAGSVGAEPSPGQMGPLGWEQLLKSAPGFPLVYSKKAMKASLTQNLV